MKFPAYSSNVILTEVNGNVIMSGWRMITLTRKDEKRLDVIQRVYRSELKLRW